MRLIRAASVPSWQPNWALSQSTDITLGAMPSLPLMAMNCVRGKSGATCSIAETKRPEWPMTMLSPRLA